jgi:predicted PurR-regulated permease PerM
MDKSVRDLILYSTLIIAGIVLLVYGLIQAQKFLIPVVLAILLAMLVLPVERKLIQWKIPKVLAVLCSDLLIIFLIIAVFFVVGLQVKGIIAEWPQYEKKLMPKIEKLQQFIEDKTGIAPREQIDKAKSTIGGANGANGAMASVSGVFSSFGNFFLIFVYMFFFLYFRQKFKNSVLNFIPARHRKRAESILGNFSRVSQRYLFVRLLLMLILSVIYSIGLSMLGISHAILVAIISAVISIIPYVGNISGVLLASFMSLLPDGSTGKIIGIIAVFSFGQILENAVLEPFIIGKRVELNPALTLLGVVAGGYIWGLPGMIIAIPVMGIIKAVFDSVPLLNPLGYVLNEKDTEPYAGPITAVKKKVEKNVKK